MRTQATGRKRHWGGMRSRPPSGASPSATRGKSEDSREVAAPSPACVLSLRGSQGARQSMTIIFMYKQRLSSPMLRTPLARRLKRRNHREVAFAQDVLVDEAYDAYPACVLHGGTAIWRCYGGTRFSEDLDAYIPGATPEADSRFRRGVAAKGGRELKFKRTGSALFAKFEVAGGVVSFEGALRVPPGKEIRGYETLEGGSVMVSVLPPDELLVEKAAAYADRRKVRDLYDALFLTGVVQGGRKTMAAVSSLLEGYAPPVDGAELRALVLAGAAPTPGEMVEALERWARRST